MYSIISKDIVLNIVKDIINDYIIVIDNNTIYILKGDNSYEA